MKQTYNTVSVENFEQAFGEPLSPFVKEKIEGLNFNYLELDPQETQKETINTLKHIFGGIKKAGKQILVNLASSACAIRISNIE